MWKWQVHTVHHDFDVADDVRHLHPHIVKNHRRYGEELIIEEVINENTINANSEIVLSSMRDEEGGAIKDQALNIIHEEQGMHVEECGVKEDTIQKGGMGSEGVVAHVGQKIMQSVCAKIFCLMRRWRKKLVTQMIHSPVPLHLGHVMKGPDEEVFDNRFHGKMVNFRPKVERKSPREAKKNKESKENGQKGKSPNQP
ncbi:hypothetical protein PIB30_056675 [Stylosanthes scabra]|uniref:Uncharacterized protein n=1 Tax=Stylosanthes scabra TaxID=79078 RepID=A0ABU6YGU8_9FABA|nr:hypothetical protein [Stylosanthes scabra]